jgi:prefoldin beta subunit
MEDIPPQVQQQIAQFQVIQQQAQAISSQKVQMELQLKEVEHSIEELKKLKKDAEVYKSIGTLLIRKNKIKISAELKERKETLELRVKTLQKQEKGIQAKLMEMQNEIQDRIKSGQPQAG